MYKNFIEYTFNTDTSDYTLGYTASKLNLGHLMVRGTSSNGDYYVGPIESIFFRGWELTSSTTRQINTLGFLKYDSEISWIFYTNGTTIGNLAKRIFLATYQKSTNTLTEIGSINVNVSDNTQHRCYTLVTSMEYHTSGTVTVNGSSVSGVDTTWVTNGVCFGNRIGFGSTSSSSITQWYGISSVVNNTTLVITKEYPSDGVVIGLSYSPGTPYVIEDFRLIYTNDSNTAVGARGVFLVKGLRYEVFTSAITTIPVATTVDNLRACYRLTDNTSVNVSYRPFGLILENKISFTEQYLYSQSYPLATTISIQKFNVRAPLILTSGRSDSAFVFTTGAQAHGGTNIDLYNPFIKGPLDHYYANFYTRVSRIIPSNIASGSTTFITDTMVETPTGTTTTFAISSQLSGISYLPNINRFYLSHLTGTIRNYITPYTSSVIAFERPIGINDGLQSNTYLIDLVDTLTTNFLSSTVRSYYHDGLSYIVRDISSNNNLMYTLPIEADKQYHTASKACVITPKFSTPNVVSYDKIYLRLDNSFNTGRLIYPSENVDIYYRTTNIDDDTGNWTLVNQTGNISGATSNDIQFKLAFSTIGINSVPSKVYGVVMSYNSDGVPISTPFYEPSIKYSDLSTETFAWRQCQEFTSSLPLLKLNIYNASSSNILLTDNSMTASLGIWEYSNNGSTWSGFTTSANSIGNYIRYIPNSSLGTNIKIKAILYT
jgi:hypothetical protein